MESPAARLLLQRIEQEQATLPAPSQDAGAPMDKPIWERILEKTADIPDDAWDKIPTDLAEQHDHCLHGTPKRLKA